MIKSLSEEPHLIVMGGAKINSHIDKTDNGSVKKTSFQMKHISGLLHKILKNSNVYLKCPIDTIIYDEFRNPCINIYLCQRYHTWSEMNSVLSHSEQSDHQMLHKRRQFYQKHWNFKVIATNNLKRCHWIVETSF